MTIKRQYSDWFNTLHKRLLPEYKQLGYLPYVWLSYLGIYFFNFFFIPDNGYRDHLTLISIPLFLLIYFRAYWVNRNLLLFHIAALFCLGTVQAHINPGASVFLIFAASFCSQLGRPRLGLLILVIMVLLILLHSWLLSLPFFYYLPATFFVMLIGGSNIYFHEMEKKNRALKLSEKEIMALGETAERERIARDLHDVIGHTFSMITMKAQLANKLFDHDIDKAKNEVQELEKISREALSQVREAVSGFRKNDLSSELLKAEALLSAAEIHLEKHIDIELDRLGDSSLSQSLGLALRELVNNIVKHSNATHCIIHISQQGANITMSIQDNGHVQTIIEGNGLTGIRERVAQLKGHIDLDTKNGFSLSVSVPR